MGGYKTRPYIEKRLRFEGKGLTFWDSPYDCGVLEQRLLSESKDEGCHGQEETKSKTTVYEELLYRVEVAGHLFPIIEH